VVDNEEIRKTSKINKMMKQGRMHAAL